VNKKVGPRQISEQPYTNLDEPQRFSMYGVRRKTLFKANPKGEHVGRWIDPEEEQVQGEEGAVLNAPVEIDEALVEAGFSEEIGVGKRGFTLLFVRDRAEAEEHFKPTTEAIKRDSLLWVAYPNWSSKLKIDINRNILWKINEPHGYRPVSQVSIDETWFGMRFLPSDMVKRRQCLGAQPFYIRRNHVPL
jgi:hypothetical protein